jgi:hypothetical protein
LRKTLEEVKKLLDRFLGYNLQEQNNMITELEDRL